MNLLPDMEKARRFLAARAAPNALVAAVTGSHYYGFPSEDSDIDLKGIHALPTASAVGLFPPPDSVDFLGEFEGTEVDYTSHELAFAFRLLLKGNGNILERLLSPLQAIPCPELTELGRGSIGRHFYGHYRGFFAHKRADFEKENPKTAKTLLYCYRTALTGIHLLATGECEGNVLATAAMHGYPMVPDLVQIKRQGKEFGSLEDSGRFLPDLMRLEAQLTQAFETSTLPEHAPNAAALDAYLIAIRRRFF